MDSEKVTLLFGNLQLEVMPRSPFSEDVIQFLDALSKALRKDSRSKLYPDITALAFWIRKGHIIELKKAYDSERTQGGSFFVRLGKGLIFHIAPSNVPVNFAYTFFFGLLAGNSNVVRVPSKSFEQVGIICDAMHRVCQENAYAWVCRENAMIRYGKEAEEVTEAYSSQCDVRVIWGGDRTISSIRQYPLLPRSTEITFADRYSFAVLSAQEILHASEGTVRKLANGFYNDTYLMDQNACTSPHLLVWLGDEQQSRKAGKRFWDAVYQAAQNYPLEDVKVTEKYALLCENAIAYSVEFQKVYDNLLYTCYLKKLPENLTDLRGKFGLFYNYVSSDLTEVLRRMSRKVQTCAVFGIEGKLIAESIQKEHIQGIDRIVPIGKTLDIDMIWDGYDIISELSRCVSVVEE